MTFYQMLWFFMIYAGIGWVIEVAYHALTLGKVVNRGFLNGPVCPVYGIGMVVVLEIMQKLPADPETGMVSVWLTFLVGMVFTTLIELAAGWLLDKAFHARWWDYSDRPFNLNGYICPLFSVIWGFAVVVAVRVAHPVIAHLSFAALPFRYGWWILAALYLVLFVDTGVTVAFVIGLNRELKQLETLRDMLRSQSDRMSEHIAKDTIELSNNLTEYRIQASLGKAELKNGMAELKDGMAEYRREFTRRMEEYTQGKHWGSRRLLNAFPHMKHRFYEDALAELQEYIRAEARKRKG
ncbi:MAG: putative ABC transporter permease [Lachnospiraceae bacterium]|nr:putative ABC transporter permease [Lachnospiraceae bacterium]